ncbi:hydroxymethylbilane synthase [Aridibaculum aurantiacum]|uniref:hydroxymethylbilane synthase n=1 Tax=Aridibaculum aurantiacum TaxID=2810307 RepID=UPI001A969201|nr:hydroxymethylbilane synthase [Aridibaculum aurantiacum]
MQKVFRIGTRDSQLAVWQATLVKDLLSQHGYAAELVYIKSEGDIDLQTPLYEIGVQGIFTRSLDIAMLEGRIDIAVHSMKDVPTQLPKGIVQAAVLKRASYKDLFVYKNDLDFLNDPSATAVIATSSIRRQAQWLHKFPNHTIENLRGNVNTRLRKVDESNWQGAIFAAAGLERIDLRPEKSIELDWMLPAPAQGAIMVVCKEEDAEAIKACANFHDEETATCTKAERDFLRALMGGCSMPISALAEVKDGALVFEGNILSVDGKDKVEVKRVVPLVAAANVGNEAANELLENGGQAIVEAIRNEGK